MWLRVFLLTYCVSFFNTYGFAVTELAHALFVRSAVGYCVKCEDWVEIYYPSKYCPKCGKKILDVWPPGSSAHF